jgi:hypothetical protein
MVSMNKVNKETLVQFGKVVWAMLIAMIIIITNVEIWNMCALGHTDGFHVVVSVLNVIWEAVISFLFFKKVVFKKKEITA